MAAHNPAAAPGERLLFIDSLRFVAAAAVLLQHLPGAGVDPVTGVVRSSAPGVFGVSLFFLLSGFVIPFSVRRGFDWWRFAVGRLFRIYPLALVAFGGCYLLGRLGWEEFANAAGAGVADWMANLLLVFDFTRAETFLGVTWTLILEFGWYALFAFGLLLFRQHAGSVLEIAAPAMLLVLIVASLLLDRRMPLGRIGMIYAAIVGYQAWRHHARIIDHRRFAIDAALFLGGMAAANGVAFGHFHHPAISLGEALWPWLASGALFFACCVSPGLRRSPLLCNRVTASLGTISFSIYLLHPFAIAAAGRWCDGGATGALALLLTLPLAIAGYMLVERPGMRLGRWLSAISGKAEPPD